MINKIVFTSPEAMVEFSREKLKPQCKNPFNMCKLYFSLEVNKPLGLQITLGSESHVMRNEIWSLCITVDDGGNLCHVSVDPSTELCCLGCGDEFG